MVKIRSYVPLQFIGGCRASNVTLFQRALNFLFGAPNARRANGIISPKWDMPGSIRRLFRKISGKGQLQVPIYEMDRAGTRCSEALPRIWLSERVANAGRADGSRIFVECYPSSPDHGGRRALELGDAYLGEGYDRAGRLSEEERTECFKAAEILYLHAIRRGNRMAAARLKMIYDDDLCAGEYYETYLVQHARHSRKRR